MISLSEEQIALVAGMRRRKFRERTAGLVMSTFPLACDGKNAATVMAEVGSLEEQGIAIGITGTRELSRFIAYHYLVSEVCPYQSATKWIRNAVEGPGSGVVAIARLDRAVKRLLEKPSEPAPET